MRRAIRLLGVGAAALALGLGSCTSDYGSDEDPAVKGASPSADASPGDSKASTPEPLDLSEADVIAPGHGLHVIGRTKGRLSPRTFADVLAVTPDGEFVVKVLERNIAEPLDLNQDRVALRDPSTGKLTYLSQGRGRTMDNQITGGAATRRWVVWLETPSTSLDTDPWTLYSHDRKSGENHRLASAPRVGKRGLSPTAPGYSKPIIVDGRVYISAVSHLEKGSPMPAIYSAPLDGSGELRKEYPNEILPQPGEHSVLTVDATGEPWRINEHSARSGRTHVIAEGSSLKRDTISEFVAAGDTAAWITNRRGTSQVYAKTGDDQARLLVRTGKRLDYPVITERYLAFETPKQTSYLYDLDDDTFYRLTRGRALVAPGNGKYVVWGDPRKHRMLAAEFTDR